MLGAILGDIIGSRFEFDRGGKTKDFELLTKDCCFTDDSVMTIALADALSVYGPRADEKHLKNSIIKTMQYWGNKYPWAGYGAKFIHWLAKDNPQPYGSFGNGSAMRVSSVGWLYETLEETRTIAKWSAEISHNHPEGIKGAECTAGVIYLARTGHSKQEIKEYVDKEFAYDYSESLDQMRQRHMHVETCMDSLPKALRSFFDGESYEDVVRNAVSLGGDTDTLAAIAGAMAEAYYGIPVKLVNQLMKMIPNDFVEVIERFRKLKVKKIKYKKGRITTDKVKVMRQKALELRSENKTYAEIGKELGVSRQYAEMLVHYEKYHDEKHRENRKRYVKKELCRQYAKNWRLTHPDYYKNWYFENRAVVFD